LKKQKLASSGKYCEAAPVGYHMDIIPLSFHVTTCPKSWVCLDVLFVGFLRCYSGLHNMMDRTTTFTI
jgi:hypothetical protein